MFPVTSFVHLPCRSPINHSAPAPLVAERNGRTPKSQTEQHGCPTLRAMKPTSAVTAAVALSIMAPLSPMAPLSLCNGYINVDGHCVASPDYNPGRSDRDGTNSHSEHGRGSGSWHGGTGGGHSK
jgi:hypothetical protein